MNRFCPCFLKCYLGSAISKCYRKNWCFETPDFLISKQRKSTENNLFSVLFMVAEAGLDLIKVWPGPLAGQQQSTGLLHLDWFESRSLRSKKKDHPIGWSFFSSCGGRTRTYALLRCPAGAASVEAVLRLADRCHSLGSLLPPPAALPSLPSGNPEVAPNLAT